MQEHHSGEPLHHHHQHQQQLQHVQQQLLTSNTNSAAAGGGATAKGRGGGNLPVGNGRKDNKLTAALPITAATSAKASVTDAAAAAVRLANNPTIMDITLDGELV